MDTPRIGSLLLFQALLHTYYFFLYKVLNTLNVKEGANFKHTKARWPHVPPIGGRTVFGAGPHTTTSFEPTTVKEGANFKHTKARWPHVPPIGGRTVFGAGPHTTTSFEPTTVKEGANFEHTKAKWPHAPPTRVGGRTVLRQRGRRNFELWFYCDLLRLPPKTQEKMCLSF